MKLDEAISILEYHQAWRLSEEHVMVEPKLLTKAIDMVLEKVKEIKPEKIDWDNLIKFFNKTFGKTSRIIPSKAKTGYLARLKEGFTKEDIRLAMTNAKEDKHHVESHFKHCTLEFFSRSDKLDKFSSIKPKSQQEKKPYIPTA